MAGGCAFLCLHMRNDVERDALRAYPNTTDLLLATTILLGGCAAVCAGVSCWGLLCRVLVVVWAVDLVQLQLLVHVCERVRRVQVCWYATTGRRREHAYLFLQPGQDKTNISHLM